MYDPLCYALACAFLHDAETERITPAVTEADREGLAQAVQDTVEDFLLDLGSRSPLHHAGRKQ